MVAGRAITVFSAGSPAGAWEPAKNNKFNLKKRQTLKKIFGCLAPYVNTTRV
jgi:hypothetical protein